MTVGVGEKITAADILAISIRAGYPVPKTAQETVNNSEVMQNDDELLLAVGANEDWVLEVLLLYRYDILTSQGTDIAWAVPAGGAITEVGTPVVENAAEVDATAVLTLDGGAGADYYYKTTYRYVGAGAAGNIQLTWAQHTAHASDNHIEEGSYILAHRLL